MSTTTGKTCNPEGPQKVILEQDVFEMGSGSFNYSP
jgi:hypothetical protein